MSATEEWTEATWADVHKGDHVRRSAQASIYRIEEVADGVFTLYSPTAGQTSGKPDPASKIFIRTRFADKLTPAGQRFDGLTPQARRALQEKLGAELVAVKASGGKTFAPWILAERYDVMQLASHLSMFHGLHTGDVTTKDTAGLRRTHKKFHAVDMSLMPETARRVPHVHDEAAFRKEL